MEVPVGRIQEMIKEAKQSKKELVPTTIRIPRDLNVFIDELAEFLSLSKQETMVRLLEDSIAVARNELRIDVVDPNEENYGFYLLNTNKGNSIRDHEWMLQEGIAAAFYDPWKFNINRVGKGDRVFLYENGVGIVAVGIGTGETLVKDHDGDVGQCHYQKLTDFKVLMTPLSSAQVKSILGRNVVFMRTMSGMPDGEKILSRC